MSSAMLLNCRMAIESQEGLLMYACVIADILERWAPSVSGAVMHADLGRGAAVFQRPAHVCMHDRQHSGDVARCCVAGMHRCSAMLEFGLHAVHAAQLVPLVLQHFTEHMQATSFCCTHAGADVPIPHVH